MAIILIADDDRVSRAILSGILGDMGHKVEEVSDGVQALERCLKETFDLVFMDIFMPEKDGLQTIKSLAEKKPELRVVPMSGGSTFTSTEPLKWSKRYGTTHIVAKPFDENAVKTVVKELLG
ncbi:MAG: response regulator [Desulfovibrio sp.]|nr:MAG: response regulator [Desulfovibrio sp.]